MSLFVLILNNYESNNNQVPGVWRDGSLVPSSTWQLRTVCNPSPRDPMPSSDFCHIDLWGTHISGKAPIHTQNNVFLINNQVLDD